MVMRFMSSDYRMGASLHGSFRPMPCKQTLGLTFIDTRDLTLGTDGKPRADLFVSDMTP